jgi:hypothetical protein
MTSFVKAARRLSAKLEEANVLSIGFEEKKGCVGACYIVSRGIPSVSPRSSR